LTRGDAIHPPKHETFDLLARTNTDPKGIVRAVDDYTVRPWGLYLARPTPGRAQFHYLESWLLPSLGLRATVLHFSPGHERDHDYYLDVGEYTPGLAVWSAEDHYLDLEVRTNAGVDLADVDELLDAVRHGLLTPEVGEQAVRRAVAGVDGLSRHGYDLQRWLATEGMDLTWRGAPTQ
jgi:predicted RNA-binding protein associated with RNAse of E/G family